MGHQPGFGYASPERPANSSVCNKLLRQTGNASPESRPPVAIHERGGCGAGGGPGTRPCRRGPASQLWFSSGRLESEVFYATCSITFGTLLMVCRMRETIR